ncbi:C-terminal binding protein [Sphingomonas sp. MG17]|uniref:C-terminal binding protein n=1 Tax=Sphingomonas tagetis TaxID=2949092 RepID=A0A9X2KMH4_9SPHN|nr:C-terminal binding protein [Sphingomonas tagetis]MCP3732609.1 C-terminal binding protein [Sphingomonas tagetis]
MRESSIADGCVLLTDHPWPDLGLETSIFERAGIRLVAGPEIAGTAAEVERLVAECSPAAILTCWAPVSRAAIELPADLRIVARLGVGLDNIDVAAATERGAWVTNVPDYCVAEVSDHALAFVLDRCRGISRLNDAVKASGWNSDASGLLRLSEQVVGILGYGRIGRETARKFKAMGCQVLAYDPYFSPDESVASGSTLATIASECDVIVIHVPLLPETTGLIDEAFLRATGRKPLIVNVSRGPIVSNQGLIAALENGWIRGACLDVIDGEPAPSPEIIAHPLVTATPHIAYASDASMAELRRRACEEVVRVLSGATPENGRNAPHG